MLGIRKVDEQRVANKLYQNAGHDRAGLSEIGKQRDKHKA